jgi:hypothetical protein
MITRRNPWRYATTKDECFVAFLHDEDWLRKALPISLGANAILKRIFHLNPLRRISLGDLRKEILQLDSFFMSEEELTVAPETVRQILKGVRSVSHNAHLVSFDNSLFGENSNKGTFSSLSSDEVYVFRSPPDDHTPLAFVPQTPIIIEDVQKPEDPSVGSTPFSDGRGSGSDSLSSGPDSDGPITPATRPIDPAIEVPDLPDGETLDRSAAFPVTASDLPNLPSAAIIKKPLWKGSRQVRMALQRLKSLSLGVGLS